VTSASKLAIVDKLLPLLEAFGASRQRQTQLRKEMKASACTHPEREVVMESLLGETRTVPCYDPTHGRTPWCDHCRQHDQAFARLMAERKSNKKRLHKIEKLAVAYSAPEPELPPEPRELLELMHQLEREAESAEAADIREGDHDEAHR
jgi:thiol-disulfide isomerase/thioredoxin